MRMGRRKKSKLPLIIILVLLLLAVGFVIYKYIDVNGIGILKNSNDKLSDLQVDDIQISKVDNKEKLGVNFTINFSMKDKSELNDKHELVCELYFPEKVANLLGNKAYTSFTMKLDKSMSKSVKANVKMYEDDLIEEDIQQIINYEGQYKVKLYENNVLIKTVYIKGTAKAE